MSRIVKITTIAHNIHFSDEMFTTRLNLTKLKSYHTLTRPQMNYIDGYADPFCKTIRLKDGKIMEVARFKQWWHDTFILPKRVAKNQAILAQRGILHKRTVSGISRVNTMKYYHGYNFGAVYLRWYENEKTVSVKLNGRTQVTKTTTRLLDGTLPCESLQTFEQIVSAIGRLVLWLVGNSIAIVDGTFKGNISAAFLKAIKPPIVKEVVIESIPKMSVVVIPKVSVSAPIEDIVILPRTLLKLQHTLLNSNGKLLELEYPLKAFVVRDSIENTSALIESDLELIVTVSYIARDIRYGPIQDRKVYVKYFEEKLDHSHFSPEVTLLLKTLMKSLIDDTPLPINNDFFETIEYAFNQPIQKFERLNILERPDNIVKAYREISRIAFAAYDADRGIIRFTHSDQPYVVLDQLLDKIDPKSNKTQFLENGETLGHTFNHVRIHHLLTGLRKLHLRYFG